MTVAARRIAGLAIAGLVFAVDLAIKAWMLARPDLHASIEVTPFFRLAYIENYGVSLGFLRADSALAFWLLLGGTTLIAAGVLIWLLRERTLPDILPLGLVLGGAAGNIVDRATHGFVVDYADFDIGGWTPFIFNLADAAISVGVVLILARSLFSREKPAVSPTRVSAPES